VRALEALIASGVRNGRKRDKKRKGRCAMRFAPFEAIGESVVNGPVLAPASGAPVSDAGAADQREALGEGFQSGLGPLDQEPREDLPG